MQGEGQVSDGESLVGTVFLHFCIGIAMYFCVSFGTQSFQKSPYFMRVCSEGFKKCGKTWRARREKGVVLGF